MKKAGLLSPDSRRDVRCLTGELAMGGRRGYEGTLGNSRLLLAWREAGDGERERRAGCCGGVRGEWRTSRSSSTSAPLLLCFCCCC